jgi:protein O-GlcNAc transferase
MRTPEFSLDRFPRDALRDLFDALSTGAPSSDPSAEERFSGVTFLVTRERNEHANLFHALTDLLNAFIAASVLGVDPSAARVLLLDDHGASATDAAWSAAFGGQGVLRAFELQRAARNRRLRLERAVFVPPGYSSTLLAELPNKDIECGGASGLITSFADYMLSAMRVGRPSPSSNRNAGLRVLFVSRRGFARDCANEDELVAAARSIAGVSSVQVEQFGSRELREQMQVVAAHDVLVGMHGAALAHLMWLPRHGGVFELRGTSDFGFYCYGHMARWNGLLYRLLEPLEARPTALATEPYPIDRAAFVRELAALVGAVQERMRSGSLRS